MSHTFSRPTPVFISLSGGVDSTTLMAKYIEEGMEVHPVFFHYPSKHNGMEFDAACKIVDYYTQRGDCIKDFQSVQMKEIFGAMNPESSALLKNDQKIPHAEYDSANIAKTIVPGRNLIFASTLAAIANSYSYPTPSIIALGVHAGDHAVYPDCRTEFIESLKSTVELAMLDKSTEVEAPFVKWTKSDIVRYGLELNVPYHLTRSCYNGDDKPCYECSTCRERLKSFEDNGVVDPLLEV